MIGVYKITNKINGKFYIGQSINIEKRFMDHRAPRSQKKNTGIAKAIKKYGPGNFVYSVIEECTEERLNELEIKYIRELKPRYNMNEGGMGNRGHRLTEEAKKQISVKIKTMWKNLPEEEKRRIIKNLKRTEIGHKVTLETREKLRAMNLGKKISDETKAKMSASQKVSMRGNKNGNKEVKQINLAGVVVNVFPSLISAAKSLGINPHQISDVLSGRRNKTAGYKWQSVN